MSVSTGLIVGAVSIAAAVALVFVWWALRGIRRGHEAGPRVRDLEQEVLDAEKQASDLARAGSVPTPTLDELRDVARREAGVE